MIQQNEIFKSVRQGVEAAQSLASERLNVLVERGRESLPQVSAQLGELQKRARGFVEETSRTQATVFAAELRKFADRLEKLSVRESGSEPQGEENASVESNEVQA